MITRNTDYSIQRLRGLSTDTKPTDVPNGSEFREMDTGKKFLYSAAGTEWIEQQGSGGGSGGGGSVEPFIVELITGGEGKTEEGETRKFYLSTNYAEIKQALMNGRNVLLKNSYFSAHEKVTGVSFTPIDVITESDYPTYGVGFGNDFFISESIDGRLTKRV